MVKSMKHGTERKLLFKDLDEYSLDETIDPNDTQRELNSSLSNLMYN